MTILSKFRAWWRTQRDLVRQEVREADDTYRFAHGHRRPLFGKRRR